MTIEKLPSGSYRIVEMVNGKRYRVTVDHKPTKEEAKRLIKGANGYSGKGTFLQYANDYIDVKNSILSPSTISGYRGIIRAFSEPFKTMQMDRIKQVDIQREVNLYAATHSPKSTRNMSGFISAVFGLYRPDMHINTTLPSKQPKEPYIPSEDDVSRILDSVRGTMFYIAFYLAALGLRKGEITALTLDDISGNTVTISKTMVLDEHNKWIIKNSPKTSNGYRQIYIPDDLLQAIKDQGYVFKGHPGNILKHLHKCQEDLNIEKFKLHAFRHYFATELTQAGIAESDILKLGGWSQSGYVMKAVYRHARIDKDKEAQKNATEKIAKGIKRG